MRNGANRCAHSVRKIAWEPLRTLSHRATRFCTPYEPRSAPHSWTNMDVDLLKLALYGAYFTCTLEVIELITLDAI